MADMYSRLPCPRPDLLDSYRIFNKHRFHLRWEEMSFFIELAFDLDQYLVADTRCEWDSVRVYFIDEASYRGRRVGSNPHWVKVLEDTDPNYWDLQDRDLGDTGRLPLLTHKWGYKPDFLGQSLGVRLLEDFIKVSLQAMREGQVPSTHCQEDGPLGFHSTGHYDRDMDFTDSYPHWTQEGSVAGLLYRLEVRYPSSSKLVRTLSIELDEGFEEIADGLDNRRYSPYMEKLYTDWMDVDPLRGQLRKTEIEAVLADEFRSMEAVMMKEWGHLYRS